MKYEYAIVGAGIVGLSIGYKIISENKNAKILIIDKESTFSKHQSGNNSNVIHSGVYYKPGSLKANNCIKGYKLLIDFLESNKVPYEICGKLIVAVSEKEIPTLKIIYNRGVENGLDGLKLLDSNEIKKYEPFVDGVQALYVPQSGITDYGMVCEKLYRILLGYGVKFCFEKKIIDYHSSTNYITITSSDKTNFIANKLINAAGLYSDKLAKISEKINYKIIPFRGEYYNLKDSAKHLVKNLIYPVPDPNFPFLGVHFTRTINGSIESGPNAVFAFSREGYTFSKVSISELIESITFRGFLILVLKFWRQGIVEFRRSLSKEMYVKSLQKLVPSIKSDDICKGSAGVRAQAVNLDGSMVDDFLIKNNKNIINICNAPSPAATSCFAIAEHVYDLLKK